MAKDPVFVVVLSQYRSWRCASAKYTNLPCPTPILDKPDKLDIASKNSFLVGPDSSPISKVAQLK